MVSHVKTVEAMPTQASLGVSYTVRGAEKLFDNAVIGVEAVLEVLGVLVRGVLGQHLAGCGALERLEACFALDSESGGVRLELTLGFRALRLRSVTLPLLCCPVAVTHGSQ